MDKNQEQFQEIWDAFLQDWPLERLRRMTLPEYTTAGRGNTFTAWIENRLDKVGSIWGGSAFKFGIYSRKDKTPKEGTASDAYTQDYAWYRKYGPTPEIAFETVKAHVIRVAEAAARGDYAAIDAVDLGEAYKWKIAFHYQDRNNPGVLAAFKPKRLQAWLKGRAGTVPQRTSEIYRLILSLHGDQDLIAVSRDVWEQTATLEPIADEIQTSEVEDDVRPEQPLNLILYGPPGTGKTYAMADLAVRICDGARPEDRTALMTRYRELRKLQRIRFVTFHPSFSYEEFVEGIRPVTTNEGQVQYEVRPGIFKQVVSYARELFERQGSANCVLILDEINRANLAKTFGELITLLEPSKRLDGPDEQEVELPYSGDLLGIPPNLYVLGTMNTADRSIALLDTALRRRFAFREMMPRPDLLATDVEGTDLRALLVAMNDRIERLFDRDHILGHTYLLGVTSFAELTGRFRDQIIPLLQEYFFEDWRRIQEVFNDIDQPRDLQIVQDLDPLADGRTGREQRRRYQVNPSISPAAVQKIYS
jgi:5-methylcytosine-specific restriction endonuclease McrBC GTP-binding regulatory subunit McrB